MTPPQSTTFRALIQRGFAVVPGAGSPLEARLIQRAGFDAIYASGYAVAATMHGIPDVGLTGATDVISAAGAIVNVASIPLLVDADTGYGDAANVRDTVRRLEQVGVSAIQIEDQEMPKRCGHMAGKRVIPAEDMIRKVHAALAARRNPETVIVARTDARAPLGLDEAVSRAQLYRAAGADVTFIDAPESREELRRIATEVPGPKLANMSESGRTPLLSAAEFEEIGFQIVLFPTSALRITTSVLGRFMAELRATGTSRGWIDSMSTLDELNDIVGLDVLNAFDDEVSARAGDATPLRT